MSPFGSFISRPPCPWLISLPPRLYSINLSIRPVDYIRDYRLKGIPLHLSLSVLALLLSLSLHNSHPPILICPPHTHVFTHTNPPVSHAFPLGSCYPVSHTPPLSTSSFLITLHLFGHVLSCHFSFSSIRLPPLQSSRLFLESVSFTSFSDILPPTLAVSFAFPSAWQSLEQWITEKETDLSSSLGHEHMNVKHTTYIYEASSVYGIRNGMVSYHSYGGWKDGNYIPRSLSGAECSHGDLNHHLNTSQLTVKRMRNWPLLPLATEVKQRRKKERKFILSIWGRKGRGRQQGGVRNTVHASRTDRRWKRQVLDRERHKAYELVQRLCHTIYNL